MKKKKKNPVNPNERASEVLATRVSDRGKAPLLSPKPSVCSDVCCHVDATTQPVP